MMRLQTRSVFLVGILLSGVFIFFTLELWSILPFSDDEFDLNSPLDDDLAEVRLKTDAPLPEKRDSKCLMHSSFDIFRCALNENKLISVYVYPNTRYLDERGHTINKAMSQEFYELLAAIVKSKYYTSDLNNACIIIPSIDTLNQNDQDLTGIARILAGLPRYVLASYRYVHYTPHKSGK